jgi:putative lipase involved disintegration of autophagic bodies
MKGQILIVFLLLNISYIFATSEVESCVKKSIEQSSNAELKKYFEESETLNNIFFLRSIVNPYDRYQKTCDDLLRMKVRFAKNYIKEAGHCFDDQTKEKMKTRLQLNTDYNRFMCNFNAEEKSSRIR